MPDLYDPHRHYDESDPRDLDDADFGNLGTAVMLTLASVVILPILVGARVYEWATSRRLTGRDIHKLLGG